MLKRDPSNNHPQVHADSSNFAAGVGKKEAYEQVLEQASALFDGQTNWVSEKIKQKFIEKTYGTLLKREYTIHSFTLSIITTHFTNISNSRSGKKPPYQKQTTSSTNKQTQPQDPKANLTNLPVNSNTSNTASLLWHALHALPSPSNKVNWAGFYVLDRSTTNKKPQLILGPFQGKVACQTILFGRGVCGAAASTKQTQLVPNVDEFPGHIACDGDSKSEIVVPVLSGGEVVAIIDIDCAVVGGFDEVDQRFLEELAGVLGRGCDWSRL